MAPRLSSALRDRYRRAPDRWSAGITLTVGLVTVALDLTDIWSYAPDLLPGRAWHLVPLSLGCLAIWLRGRKPMTALLAGAVLAALDIALGGSVAMILVFFELLYAAALRTSEARRRLLRSAIAVVIGAVTLASWLATRDTQLTVFMTLQAFALFATPYWWAAAVREGQEHAAAEARRADDLVRLGELRRAETVREERARMARDLHDAIAGELSAVAIHAEATLERLEPGHRATPSVTAVREASVTALSQMRAMIQVLRGESDPLTAPERLATLESIVERSRRGGLDVRVEGRPPPLEVVADQSLARIVQESLTNALKHNPGSPVRIRFDDREEDVRLVVRSEGSDARPESGGGYGLVTMRERAEALGGTFRAGWETDAAGVSWVVDATLPRRAP